MGCTIHKKHCANTPAWEGVRLAVALFTRCIMLLGQLLPVYCLRKYARLSALKYNCISVNEIASSNIITPLLPGSFPFSLPVP